MTHHHVTLSEAMQRLTQHGERFAPVFARGSLEVELYHPLGRDHQTPHDRDELYVVVTGAGRYRCAGTCTPFGPGALLFAAAGVPHRFEDFGDDLVLWVVFFGPLGGERPPHREVLGKCVPEVVAPHAEQPERRDDRAPVGHDA